MVICHKFMRGGGRKKLKGVDKIEYRVIPSAKMSILQITSSGRSLW